MVLNFFQLMKLLIIVGVDDTGLHIVSRRIGLWSEVSSLRFAISVRYGSRTSAISSMSGLWIGFVGK